MNQVGQVQYVKFEKTREDVDLLIRKYVRCYSALEKSTENVY